MNINALKRSFVNVAAALACGTALAQTPLAAATFQPTHGCESVKGYDPA